VCVCVCVCVCACVRVCVCVGVSVHSYGVMFLNIHTMKIKKSWCFTTMSKNMTYDMNLRGVMNTHLCDNMETFA